VPANQSTFILKMAAQAVLAAQKQPAHGRENQLIRKQYYLVERVAVRG
jgi:hypothetical protein